MLVFLICEMGTVSGRAVRIKEFRPTILTLEQTSAAPGGLLKPRELGPTPEFRLHDLPFRQAPR